jgi:predicted transcriptional regulator
MIHRSKLELYQEIISTLATKACIVDNLAFECNIDCLILQERLDFLMQHNLVNIDVKRDNRAFYVLTRRGMAIAKTLSIAKRLEKLQTKPDTSIQMAAAAEMKHPKTKRIQQTQR